MAKPKAAKKGQVVNRSSVNDHIRLLDAQLGALLMVAERVVEAAQEAGPIAPHLNYAIHELRGEIAEIQNGAGRGPRKEPTP